MGKETISIKIKKLLSPIFDLSSVYLEKDKKRFLEAYSEKVLSLSFENKSRIMSLLRESKFILQVSHFENLIVQHWVLIAFISGQSNWWVKKDLKKVQEIAEDAFSKKEEIKKFLQENKL